MSASTGAKRLRSGVPTDRFHWQRRGNPLPAESTTVRPMFAPADAPPATEVPVPIISLPSTAADALAAAEQAAFDRGYEAGHRDGYRAIKGRTEESFARIAAAVEDVRSLRMGLLQQAEHEAVRLAIAISEHVLRRAVEDDPGQLVALARHALDRLDGTLATIHLHPEDLRAVAATVTSSATSGIELAADANLPPGGCLVKSSFGVVDLGIEAQVREIARTLLGDDEEGEAAYGSRLGR